MKEWPPVKDWCREFVGIDDGIAQTREVMRRELVEAVGWEIGSHASFDILCAQVRSLRALAEQRMAEVERRQREAALVAAGDHRDWDEVTQLSEALEPEDDPANS